MFYYFAKWYLRSFLYRLFFKKMGLFSLIGKPILIRGFKKINIGEHVHILPGLRIEAVSKDSKITICDRVAIAQNVHITAGGNLVIGKGASILANVCITDIDHDYSSIDVNIRTQPYIISKTEIGENCMIGFGSVILAGTCLGNQCIVAANSVVRGIFPDFCVIAGSPAKIIKQYNPQTKQWEKYEA